MAGGVLIKNDFKGAREKLTENTKELINQWTKKDLEDFTEYLFKNRQKDKKGILK